MIFTLTLLVALAYCATALLASFRSMVRTGIAAVCLAAVNMLVSFVAVSVASGVVWAFITAGALLVLRNIVRNARSKAAYQKEMAELDAEIADIQRRIGGNR